jgi:hypothetical protein
MFTSTRRFVSITLPTALLMLALAAPASAQFGGLKKKIKAAAGAESDAKDQGAAQGKDGGAAGTETVVVNDQTVGQLIAGLKAGRAEREAAAKEDNSRSRYDRDLAAYQAAKDKCETAKQNVTQRMMADEKFRDRYSATADKMFKAQEKGDQKLYAAYGDSTMALIDPSCLAKEPKRPDDYYDAQREIDNRAEQAEIKGSGLARGELAAVKERAWGILQGAPGDASASEQAAVNTRGAELKQLMGIQEQQPARAKKAAPAPAPPPAAAPTPQPGMSDAQTQTANCMAQNAQKHQKEIEALGQRAQAAQQANDMNTLMAISDTIQKIQRAGCH